MKKFFSDLWAKIKADIVNACTLISTVISGLVMNIDKFADALVGAHLEQQIDGIWHDAKMVATYVFGVSIIATIANFKKLVQTPK